MNPLAPLCGFTSRTRQQGAALVVGMVLLLVLTLLAISGMNTATLELQMAGNAQYAQNAFQIAETGIERAMLSGNYNTGQDFLLDSSSGSVPDPDGDGGDGDGGDEGDAADTPIDSFQAVMRHNPDNGTSDIPDGGFSMGVGTGFRAYHFDVTSTGASARGARSTHVQSFYIKGQAGE